MTAFIYGNWKLETIAENWKDKSKAIRLIEGEDKEGKKLTQKSREEFLYLSNLTAFDLLFEGIR